jgi:hypothetical protein
MGEYKGLKGFKVRSLATDPTTDLGQMWYDTGSNTLQFDGVGNGAWATGTSIPLGVQYGASFGHTNNAGLMCGGQSQANIGEGTNQTTSFSYDGSSWTEEAAINTMFRNAGGWGTSTAAMKAGGLQVPSAEIWNGTSWTTQPTTVSRNGCNGGGTITAAIVIGGEPGPRLEAEEWNGTGWTAIADISVLRAEFAITSQGTPTAMQIAGGTPPLERVETEQYNGTAWTEVGDLTFGRSLVGSGGTIPSAIIYGGVYSNPPVSYLVTGACEVWNGTTWTETGDLATARQYLCPANGNSSATASLAIGGANKPVNHSVNANVEEWDGAPAGVQTVTLS